METLSKKENVIPPSEVERIIDILPYTPSVKNSHTQPSVKNSHTPPSACGLVWSMGILHLGLSMGILHLGCIRKNIYTPPSFGGRNVPFSLRTSLFSWFLPKNSWLSKPILSQISRMSMTILSLGVSMAILSLGVSMAILSLGVSMAILSLGLSIVP